jgi:hypothetical protein
LPLVDGFPYIDEALAVSKPVVFLAIPNPRAATSTDTVQEEPAATPEVLKPPPEPYAIILLPGWAAITPPVTETDPKKESSKVPKQEVAALGGSATIIPAGRLSVNVILNISIEFAVLSMVKVRVDLPPWEMDEGKKLLKKPGRFVATVRSAAAGPLLPSLEVRSPLTLVWVPGVLAVTFTLMRQEEEGLMAPSLKVMVAPPSGASRIPPHSETAWAGVAMVTPAGRVSIKASSVTEVPLELTMVNCRAAILPGPMVLGEKLRLKAGGL